MIPGGKKAQVWARLLADRLFRLSTPFRQVNPDAVLVFGCPKSGTSAVAHLLADAGALKATVDIPTFWQTPAADVLEGRISIDTLLSQHKAYFSRDLIKEPGLTAIMDTLVSRLEAKKVVFVVRDPVTTVRSILQRRGVPGHLTALTSAQRLQLSKRNWHWTYDWPYKCEPHEPAWLSGRHYVEGLAMLWQSSVDALVRTQGQGASPVVIRYEDFIEGKQAVIHQTLEALGVEVKVDISSALDRQFQPAGDHSKPVQDFFGPDNFDRIIDATHAGREMFNYSA